jgi:hypothetical protein
MSLSEFMMSDFDDCAVIGPLFIREYAFVHSLLEI